MSNGIVDESIRCFAAIPVDASVLHAIRKTQGQLKKRCPSTGIKWVDPRQIHLTLRFYGDVPSSNMDALKAALEKACRGIAPFELAAENMGCFPDWDRPRVIWAGLSGNGALLKSLHASIEAQTQAFGEKNELQEFKPHLTLARVKTQSQREMREIGEKLRAATAGSMGRWQVTQLHLIKSRLTPQGPVYETLASTPLRPV